MNLDKELLAEQKVLLISYQTKINKLISMEHDTRFAIAPNEQKVAHLRKQDDLIEGLINLLESLED